MVETLRKLKEGKQVSIPIYNFLTHSREKQQKAIYGANVIIFEGIMAFAHKSLLELMDMKIFVDTGKLVYCEFLARPGLSARRRPRAVH